MGMKTLPVWFGFIRQSTNTAVWLTKARIPFKEDENQPGEYVAGETADWLIRDISKDFQDRHKKLFPSSVWTPCIHAVDRDSSKYDPDTAPCEYGYKL